MSGSDPGIVPTGAESRAGHFTHLVPAREFLIITHQKVMFLGWSLIQFRRNQY